MRPDKFVLYKLETYSDGSWMVRARCVYEEVAECLIESGWSEDYPDTPKFNDEEEE